MLKYFVVFVVALTLVIGCAGKVGHVTDTSKPIVVWIDAEKTACPPPVKVAAAPPVPAPVPVVKPVIKIEPIYFDFDKSNIKPSEAAKLDKVIAHSKDNPKAIYNLVGNCDVKGSVAYNIKLGQKRADAAKSYLVKKGLDAKRILTATDGKKFANKVWTATDRRVDIVLK